MAETEERMERHPIAELFPELNPVELDNLRQDILKSNGVSSKSPVITFDGKVIEKWHEYSTCVEFNLPYTAKKYEGDTEDLISYLLQNNSTQLAQHNRAFIAAHLKKSYRAKARENQSIAGTGKQTSEVFHTRKAAAEFMKVSPRMVSNAESIIDNGHDELRKHTIDGLISISRAADIARLETEKQNEFINTFNSKIETVLTTISSVLVADEERARERYEKEVRDIKNVYKDKRQSLSRDMSKRISLADAPEEEKQLKEERLKARRDLKKYENTNLEKAKLNYEKQRTKFHKRWNDLLNRSKKKHLAELVPAFLNQGKEYVVYLQWDYELGEIELRAAYDKMVSWDKETDIIILKSGRKLYDGPEAIASTHTADMAKEICDDINAQKFCREHRIFRPNSWQQKIYNRISEDFLEKAQKLIFDE
jgi:hypothetical protein